MSLIKNKQEIIKIKIAAQVVGKILSTLKKLIAPQTTGLMLAQKAQEIITQHGCQPNFLHYRGFPNVICVSINDQLIHGIPNDYPFQEGDLVSVDAGCQYQGYHADASLTVIVGQPKNKGDSFLLSTTKNALDLVIKKIKPGMTVGDIGHLVNQVATLNNYYVCLDYAGHGIGKQLHEEPMIYNFGKPQTGTVLQPGMVICVEPMFLQGSSQIKLLPDGWTVVSTNQKNNCHFEHTILITENGCQVLSLYD